MVLRPNLQSLFSAVQRVLCSRSTDSRAAARLRQWLPRRFNPVFQLYFFAGASLLWIVVDVTDAPSVLPCWLDHLRQLASTSASLSARETRPHPSRVRARRHQRQEILLRIRQTRAPYRRRPALSSQRSSPARGQFSQAGIRSRGSAG